MSSYWTRRLEQQKKLLAGKSIEETEKELARLYKKALIDNEKQLKSLLYDLEKNGEDRIIDIYQYNIAGICRHPFFHTVLLSFGVVSQTLST